MVQPTVQLCTVTIYMCVSGMMMVMMMMMMMIIMKITLLVNNVLSVSESSVEWWHDQCKNELETIQKDDIIIKYVSLQRAD